ncbi:MAG: hypothetical protein OIF54_18900, partial [Cohaesibacter sp.]|nr:hypothetical protein [Cohaesibacter sp.]
PISEEVMYGGRSIKRRQEAATFSERLRQIFEYWGRGAESCDWLGQAAREMAPHGDLLLVDHQQSGG